MPRVKRFGKRRVPFIKNAVNISVNSVPNQSSVSSVNSNDNSVNSVRPSSSQSETICQSKTPSASKKETDKFEAMWPKHNLPKAVLEAIRPTFVDLSDPALLKRCLHGKTQNQNESFNNMIWTRIHKKRLCRPTHNGKWCF